MMEEIQYILWRKKGVESEVCVCGGGGGGGGLQPNKTQQSGISAQQRYRPAKSLCGKQEGSLDLQSSSEEGY